MDRTTTVTRVGNVLGMNLETAMVDGFWGNHAGGACCRLAKLDSFYLDVWASNRIFPSIIPVGPPTAST